MPQPSGSNPTHSRDPSKPPRVLSCMRCKQKKIKCDRSFPCAHCRKVGPPTRTSPHQAPTDCHNADHLQKAAVQCLASASACKRRRLKPNHALKERLARCEQLLTRFEAENERTAVRLPLELSPPESRSVELSLPISKWAATSGKLVEETDGKVSFMDNALLRSVHEELRIMRDIIGADETDNLSPTESDVSDNNSDLILGGDSPLVPQEKLWPDAGCVIRLWQTYIDRVDPLTKIIHVPTFQPLVVEATNGSQNIPDNMVALMFAIFLMAVVSLSDQECQDILRDAKETLLRRFSSGVRQTLHRLEFLKTHDLATVQALVLYLISLQGRYDRHAAWVLNGVVIRIAQKIGLHRDGEELGLSPFEAEIRRRVWWQIIGIDAKYAVLSGLGHSHLPRDWDAREPGNFNDADLHPSSPEPFRDRDGPTEMILCLIQYTFSKFLVQTPGLEPTEMMNELSGLRGHGANAVTAAQIAYYRANFEDLEQSLIGLLETRCDPSAGPMHEFAHGLIPNLIKKKRELFKTAENHSECGTEVQGNEDNTFKAAIATLELNAYFYSSFQDTGFLWFSLLHLQLDVVLYIAGQLYHRTDGQLVQRAWDQMAIIYRFHPKLLDGSKKAFWTLAQFVLRAWTKRQERLDQLSQRPSTPDFIMKLRDCFGEDIRVEPASLKAKSPMASSTGASDHSTGATARTDVRNTPFDMLPETYPGQSDLDSEFLQTIAADPCGLGQQNTMGFLGFGAGPLIDW